LHGIAEQQEMGTMSGENKFVANLFKMRSTFQKWCNTPVGERVVLIATKKITCKLIERLCCRQFRWKYRIHAEE